MKKTLRLIALLAILPAGTALADDDCYVPMSQWQPRSTVKTFAKKQGWTVRRVKIDDGCYEIYGRDSNGREFEVTLRPDTLAVLKIEYDEKEDDDHD